MLDFFFVFSGQEVDVLYALEPHLKAKRILNLMVEMNKRSYSTDIEVSAQADYYSFFFF